MYHIGQPTKRRHRIRRLLIAVGLVAIVVGTVMANRALRADTVVHQAAATTTQVSIATPKTKLVTKPSFSLNLPTDWQEVSQASTFTEYSWQGSTKADDARRLDVYVDNLPTTLAVNRLQPVQAEGSGVMANGMVSDNCINFTDKSTANPTTGAAPAKWSGVNFLCDTANTIREVVGTGSADGINTVNVQGVSGVTHRYFFVYTDHSAQADFDLFVTILTSFKAQ